MKFTTAFALLFACLFASSLFIETIEAGKTKKLLAALLLLSALKHKKIIIPLPLPIPIPIIKKQTQYVKQPYPVYVSQGYGGGGGGYGGGGYGGGGYGGGYEEY